MFINLIKSKITFLWLLIFVSFGIGINSFLSIPKENTPAVNIPMFIINTISYGQSPETIEKNITNNLEDEIKSISGIKKVESVSNFNFSTVIATFNDSKDIIEAKLDLQDAISASFKKFPKNTLTPIIKHVSPDDSPVYSFGVSSEAVSAEIYDSAKSLEDSLKGIEGISEVNVIGKPNKKVSVYLDYQKMNQFGLNIGQVAGILSHIFINQVVDKKAIGENLYSYEITTFSKDINVLLEEIKNIDILNANSRSIKIRDVANVYYEEISEGEKSYIGEGEKFYNTVSFDVKSTPGSDVESLVKAVKEKIEAWKTKNPKFKVFETFSKLVQIDSVYGTFVSNFRQSGLTIMIILFLFLGMRISLGVTIAFPLVYFITFILLVVMGYTFNSIVSFSLVLTLGIMVDNLIVITEGIVGEFKEHKGIKFWDAAKNALDKYAFSIIPGTLITVFMFLPISFMVTGTVGQFIFPLGVTIAFTLVTSLIVSIILLPIILAKVLPRDITHSDGILTGFLTKVGIGLSKISKIFIVNKFMAFLTVIVFWVMLFFSFFLVGSGVIKTDFMPQIDKDNIFVNIKYPTGYTIDKNSIQTKKILADINKFLYKKYKDDIEFVYVNIGNIYSTSAVGSASNITADYQSYINIKLTPGDDREPLSYKVSEELSNYINTVIKKKYVFLKDINVLGGISMSGGKEIGFYIIGDDINKISNYLEKIKPEIAKIEGAYNISTNYEFTNGKVTYYIDANKVKRSKFPLSALVYLFSSIENSSYIPNGIPLYSFTSLGDDAIPLKLYTKYKGNIEDIKIGDNFVSNIANSRNLEAELKNIAHIDGNIQLTIEADKKASAALGGITTQIKKIIKNNPLPEGLKFRYNAAIEDSSGASADLGTALLAGVLLMFFILVLKFNSIKYGIIILTSTILSFIGVVIALGIAGLPLSFPAQLGLFGVIGVGVNNAILFIDGFNLKVGMDLRGKLIDSVKSRFIPIFLTSSTTIAGLVTLALKDELWGGLAIAFIGGLLANIAIIFFYFPAILFLSEREKKVEK